MTDKPRTPSKPRMSSARGSSPTLTAPGAEGGRRPRRARGDEPTLMAPVTRVLYRVVDAAELARIQERGHRSFAPMEGAETVQLLVDEDHARALAGPGWVVRFAIQQSVLAEYQPSGAPPRQEYRLPAAHVAVLNASIVGPIVVLR